MADNFDIFISYKEKDGAIAANDLATKLSELGYSNVYFNETNKCEGSFKERLDKAIKSCTDFILLLTPKVIEAVRCKNTGHRKNNNLSCNSGYEDDFDFVLWVVVLFLFNGEPG